jgi:hypothetical protein
LNLRRDRGAAGEARFTVESSGVDDIKICLYV